MSRCRSAGGLPHLAIALLFLAGLLGGCTSFTRPWQAPEVTLIGLRAKELTLERQVFIATLAVRNPNDRTLPIKSMTYRLSLEGEQVAEGGGALERQIPAFGEERAEVEVVGSLVGLAPRLAVFALQDRPLGWTLSGMATIADGLLTLPYRYSGEIDARALLARVKSPRVR